MRVCCCYGFPMYHHCSMGHCSSWEIIRVTKDCEKWRIYTTVKDVVLLGLVLVHYRVSISENHSRN